MYGFLERQLWLAVVVLLIALGGRGWAEEAVRTWTLPNGRVVEARLVKDVGDTVQLQTPEGKTGTLRVDGLTESDRAYVESLRTPAAAPAAGPEVLVIYSTEFQAAEAIVQLLNEYSFKARMQSTLTVAEQPRLGGARLVVLSRDTEAWCTSQAGAMLVREVRQTKRAVLAIGLSGSRLYSRMELSIGRNPVAFTGDSVLAQEAGDVVFSTPQDLGVKAGATLRLYEKPNTVYGILIDPKPAYVAGLANVIDPRSGYLGLAVEDELYGFWGFGGSPQIMSEVGRQLFVNLANRLVEASAEQEAPEPEAPPARAEPTPEREPEAPPPDPAANAPGATGTRIYQPGTEPTYPPKSLDKFQVYPTSKDARAASLSYDLEVTLRTVDNEVLTSRSRGPYNQSRQASGNYRYRPLVRVTARNKDIAKDSILAIEYYRRPVDGGSEKNLAGVQHVVLPEIKRGASVLVEASGISLFKSEYRARYGSSASGFELFGVVAGLFDPDEKFLFQVATQQSLKDLASPTLLPADL